MMMMTVVMIRAQPFQSTRYGVTIDSPLAATKNHKFTHQVESFGKIPSSRDEVICLMVVSLCTDGFDLL
ncbi:hypothetical protein CFP56_043529 [Quercus suber]|uniref:Uncharacterized protein n=1 Tax=Quercus suber TaxID=58331 RepID=A0AAW0LI26_QUESU